MDDRRADADIPPDDEDAWACWRNEWRLRDGVIYLNHGSFGPPPERVRRSRRQWQDRLDAEPMDFFVRQLPPAWRESRRRLAEFVGADESDLALVDNATVGMNVVADTFRLQPGDEVLLTDHEYGAVERIWRRACSRSPSAVLRIARLPLPVESAEQVVDAIFAAANHNTKLLVVSHVTSPTAIIMPIREICRRAKLEGIAVCVDGPHAPGHVRLAVGELDCDFYTASCHKWLSAPFGSGFLYAAPKHQELVQPAVMSWGRLPPNEKSGWSDEFLWSGTKDPSANLSIPAAIGLLRSIGLECFRRRTHYLAAYARNRLERFDDQPPVTPDSPQWYGSMAHVPLPGGDADRLQADLWRRFRIEVPIIDFQGRRYVRVSCHLYNTLQDIDRLARALRQLL